MFEHDNAMNITLQSRVGADAGPCLEIGANLAEAITRNSGVNNASLIILVKTTMKEWLPFSSLLRKRLEMTTK